MKRFKHATITVGLLGLSSIVLAFSSGPPDARTGAPSEQTCVAAGCHGDFVLNSGSGQVTIIAPTTYQAGDTLDIEVKLAQTGQMRWGFELTALDASDQPAGELVITEATRTQKTTALSGREYVKHRLAGTDPGTADSTSGWTLKWVANNGVNGDVTFYAAGNAANANSFPTGDFIYTTLATVSHSAGPGCCNGMTGNVDNDTGEIVDIGDLTALIGFLFIPPNTPPICMDEANTDGDIGGVVDIGDLTALIGFLFIPPNTPPATCQ